MSKNRIRTLGDNVAFLAGAFWAAREASTEFDRLSRMSDANLARQGLSRGDISRVVMDRFNLG